VTIENTPNSGRFYIIVEGEAVATKTNYFIRDRRSNLLGPGDSFAAVACLSGRNEIETVQARTDMKLLVVEWSQFAELAQSNTQIVMKIIMQFVANIRALNAMITAITVPDRADCDNENTDLAPRLYRIGEFYQGKNMYNQAYYAYHRCAQNYPDSSFSDVAKESMEEIKSLVTQENFDYPKETLKRIYPKNAMLFAESEPGKELFFIIRGRVKLSRIKSEKEIPLSFLEAGDICGKIAMLGGLPHTTNAITLEECETFAVGPAGLESMTKSQPHFLFRLSLKLAREIWVLHKQIANRGLRDPLARLYDVLAVMVEKEGVPLGESYQFHFGVPELVDMAGYTQQTCGEVIKKLFSEKFVTLGSNGEIRVVNSTDLIRKNESNWKVAGIPRS
jgi:CRP/FNR family transcriptional regulator